MKLEYEWSREDLKKKLKKKRKTPNIVLLIFGVALYFYITYYGIIWPEFDTWILLLGFLIYLTVLLIIIRLSTILYVFSRLRRNDRKTDKAYGTYYIELDDETITSKINDFSITYKWKDISTFKNKKKYFFIATKEDKLGLLFTKEVIEEEKYNKLLEFVEKRIGGK